MRCRDILVVPCLCGSMSASLLLEFVSDLTIGRTTSACSRVGGALLVLCTHMTHSLRNLSSNLSYFTRHDLLSGRCARSSASFGHLCSQWNFALLGTRNQTDQDKLKRLLPMSDRLRQKEGLGNAEMAVLTLEIQPIVLQFEENLLVK